MFTDKIFAHYYFKRLNCKLKNKRKKLEKTVRKKNQQKFTYFF